MKRFLICLIFSLPVSCLAQLQLQQQQQQQQRGDAPAAADSGVKLTPAELKLNQTKARDLLQIAEAEARGLEPGMRALTLSQIGSAYAGVDQKKATALLHDAFTATTEMDPGQPGTTRFLQDRVLSSLFGLEGDAIAELIPRAEPDSRTRAYGMLIRRAAEKKDFARAMELVNQAAADSAPFPYDGVTSLLLALPPDDYGDRMNAFLQAYTAYSRSTNTGAFSNNGFDRIIVRFGTLLPKDMTMKAIDEVLNRAKTSDNDARFTLSSAAGSASFNSSYDYYVFELLPVIRKFDPARADDLVQQNNQLQGVISKYPNGVTSLDPTIRDTPAKPGENSGMGFSISSNKGSNSNRSASGNMAPSAIPGTDMMQVVGQYQAEIERIRDLAAKDARLAISQAMNLPETIGKFPVRVTALEGIARAAWGKQPEAAHSAVDEMVKAASKIQPDQQGRFLIAAADLYLKLKDDDAAHKTIDEGLKNAQALYETDSNADDPNQALKGYWPSTSLWAQCVALAYNSEPDKVPQVLAAIKDDDIRTWLRVAYALALTGNSPNSITTMVTRKNQQSIMTTDMR